MISANVIQSTYLDDMKKVFSNLLKSKFILKKMSKPNIQPLIRDHHFHKDAKILHSLLSAIEATLITKPDIKTQKTFFIGKK